MDGLGLLSKQFQYLELTTTLLTLILSPIGLFMNLRHAPVNKAAVSKSNQKLEKLQFSRVNSPATPISFLPFSASGGGSGFTTLNRAYPFPTLLSRFNTE